MATKRRENIRVYVVAVGWVIGDGKWRAESELEAL